MATQRLTDAQVRNERSQSLRAVRRMERAVDTQIERMERKLDRAIENKSKITVRLMLGVADDYRELQAKMNDLGNIVTDAINIFTSSS